LKRYGSGVRKFSYENSLGNFPEKLVAYLAKYSKKITKLELYGISEASLHLLMSSIKDKMFPFLYNLSLYVTSQTTMGNDTVELAANVLKKNITIGILGIGGKIFGEVSDKQARCYSDLISSNSTMHELNLRIANVEPNDCTRIIQALAGNKIIRKLHIFLSFNDDTITEFSKVILNNTLYHLELCGDTTSIISMAPIFDAIAQNTSIKKLLILSKNALENGYGKQALELNKTLQHLAIFNSNTAAAICKCLYKNNLNNLEILDSMVGGLLDLTAMIQNNTSLSELNFDDTALGKKIVSNLFIALTSNKTIKKLNLSGSSIPADLAESVANYLKNNHTLKYLSLNRCSINDDGAQLILKSMEFNHSIATLTMWYNDFCVETTALILLELLEENPMVHTIELFGNQFNDLKESTTKKLKFYKNNRIFGLLLLY